MELSALSATIPRSDASEERALIERAKRDRHAFALLYRQHYRAIAGYLYRRTGDRHATEDLVADVFVAALRWLPRYHHRGVPFRGWLYRIATNTANRWARRRPRHEALHADRPAVLTGDSPERSDLRERARRALLAMPPKYQAVLALHYLEGLSVDEVAAILGCRAGTVKSRLSRAREQMRARL